MGISGKFPVFQYYFNSNQAVTIEKPIGIDYLLKVVLEDASLARTFAGFQGLIQHPAKRQGASSSGELADESIVSRARHEFCQ